MSQIKWHKGDWKISWGNENKYKLNSMWFNKRVMNRINHGGNDSHYVEGLVILPGITRLYTWSFVFMWCVCYPNCFFAWLFVFIINRVHLNLKQKVTFSLLSIISFYYTMANSPVPLPSHTIHGPQMPSCASSHLLRTILLFLFIHHMHSCSRYYFRSLILYQVEISVNYWGVVVSFY